MDLRKSIPYVSEGQIALQVKICNEADKEAVIATVVLSRGAPKMWQLLNPFTVDHFFSIQNCTSKQMSSFRVSGQCLPSSGPPIRVNNFGETNILLVGKEFFSPMFPIFKNKITFVLKSLSLT